jgi:CRISPR system Cascade subunit CasE
MFLSRLVLNIRSREARRDLSNAYELHRTVMRAFPCKDEGGPGRVLFRLDSDTSGNPPVVLVQSEKQPNWAFLKDSGYGQVDGPKPLDILPIPGQRLRFRLRANPTVCRAGKRQGLYREEDQRRWFERKATEAGFRPVGFSISPNGLVSSRKSGSDDVEPMHNAAVFDGVIEITDPGKFSEALRHGIGAAKGFGFGLLSIARA